MKHYNRNIISGLLIIAIIILPLVISLVFSLKQVIVDESVTQSKDLKMLLLASELRNIESRQRALVTVFILTGNDRLLEQLTTDSLDFEHTVSALKKIPLNNAGMHKVKTLTSVYKEQVNDAKFGIAMRRQGADINAVNSYFKSLSRNKADLNRYAMDDLVRYATLSYEAESDRNLTFAHRVIKYLGFAAGVGFILLLIIIWLLIRMIRHKSLLDEANQLVVQKEMQRSLARKEVLEVVAHDLKSPLSAILLSTNIVGKELEHASASIHKYLKIISNSGESMQRLISQLLDHSKIESGSLQLTKELTNLDALIKMIVLRFQPIAARQYLQLDLFLDAGNWLVVIDTGRVEQVISNVISNAIKFSRPSGVITLQLQRENDFAVFSVSDTGVGMSETEIDRVFDRYWQARETASQGTGLGLAISKGIIDAHGGNIRVESNIGKGSLFYISIPMRTEISEVNYIQPLKSFG